MKLKKPGLLIAALLIVFSVITPKTILATTRVVVTNTSQCPAETTTTLCYLSVTEAIYTAIHGDSIEIRPGTYTGNFTIDKSVSISGNETAATFLSGGGSGPVLTIDSATTTGVSVRRLTFINASTGIHALNSPAVTITNNIFQVGTGNIAISLTASTTTEISNNTFHQNKDGILSTYGAVNVKNNIFSSQTTAISSNIAVLGILNNLFFNSGISSFIIAELEANGNIAGSDPLFVDSTQSDINKRDFHLKSGSPGINAGSPSVGKDIVDDTIADIGAYGGPTANTIPYIVSGVTATVTTAAPYTITVNWSANNAYTVKGYKVYYGTAPGNYNGTGATEGNSPVLVTNATGTTLSNLLVSTVTPTAPVLNQPQPLNERLFLSWSAVPGATGYKVHYGAASTVKNILNVGNTTSYFLSGLTNGQTYVVAVSATAQSAYYMAVTAHNGITPSVPGVSHESAYSSEVSVSIGSAQESALSNEVSDYPEAIISYPNLPNEGCFIATAAFGYYSAPQVRALRDFRDRYLLTNRAGKAFVRWYYAYGPAAAQFISEHPSLKPVVRAALMPAVGAALFMTRTSLFIKTIAILCILIIALITAYRFSGKRFSGSGGVH